MSENAELIAEAIRSLAPTTSLFKEYAFPILSAFFSVILGALAAYFTLLYQQRSEAEKEKLRACNDWILQAENMFQSLVAMKTNYVEILPSDPLGRFLAIPTILGKSSIVERPVSELSFLVPRLNDPSSLEVKWRSLSRINGMVVNYNTVIQLWETRNTLERPIRESLARAFGNGATAEASLEQVLDHIGYHNTAAVIDLTEKVITMTDDVILELHDFMEKFPAAAASAINMRIARRFGAIVQMVFAENNHLKKRLARCQSVDFTALSNLFHIPEAELRAKYRPTYPEYSAPTE